MKHFSLVKGVGFLVVCLASIFLLARLQDPLLDLSVTRQIQTAEVTRNLYRDEFNPFNTKVNYLGRDSKKLIVEFPIFNLIVVFLYKIVGGVQEWLGRFTSFITWIF